MRAAPSCAPTLAAVALAASALLGSGFFVPARATSSPVESTCRSLEHEQKRILEEARTRLGQANLLASAPFGSCRRSGRGAWVLRIEGFVQPKAGDLMATWSVVHIDEAGRAVSARSPMRPSSFDATSPGVNFSCGGHSCLHPQKLAVFDYDGDGEGELLVWGEANVEEGAQVHVSQVWTYRAGAVSLYGPARSLRFVDVKDVDGDGRPDLLTHGPYYDASEGGCAGFPIRRTGPLLLARSRPDGTFSMRDEAAVAYARRSCPARPPALPVGRANGTVDPDETLARLVCARLWQVAPARLLADLKRCPAPPKEDCGRDDRLCPDAALMRRFIQHRPPLELR